MYYVAASEGAACNGQGLVVYLMPISAFAVLLSRPVFVRNANKAFKYTIWALIQDGRCLLADVNNFDPCWLSSKNIVQDSSSFNFCHRPERLLCTVQHAASEQHSSPGGVQRSP